jgi:hypothetical protein
MRHPPVCCPCRIFEKHYLKLTVVGTWVPGANWNCSWCTISSLNARGYGQIGYIDGIAGVGIWEPVLEHFDGLGGGGLYWNRVHCYRGHNWPTVPAPDDDDDDDECGPVGGMIGRGNRSTRRKPVPVPLCPPQMPHDLTRARTRSAAEWSLRLTAWATARPFRWFAAVLTGREWYGVSLISQGFIRVWLAKRVQSVYSLGSTIRVLGFVILYTQYIAVVFNLG